MPINPPTPVVLDDVQLFRHVEPEQCPHYDTETGLLTVSDRDGNEVARSVEPVTRCCECGNLIAPTDPASVRFVFPTLEGA